MKKTKKKISNKELHKRQVLLTLEILMYDITSDFDTDRQLICIDKRVEMILLCIDNISEIQQVSKRADWFSIEINVNKFYRTIGLYLTGRYEGSILKTDYSNGGYNNLHILHKLETSLAYIPKYAQKAVKAVLRGIYNNHFYNGK